MKILTTVFIIIAGLVLVASIKTALDVSEVYDFLEAKTEWCYSQNGIMLEVHCFSKDMKLIEIPPNHILVY